MSNGDRWCTSSCHLEVVAIATMVVDVVPGPALFIGNSPGVGVPARATIANSVTPGARIDIRPVRFATLADTELRVAIKVVTDVAEFPTMYELKVN